MNEEQSLAKLSELIDDIATVVTVKYQLPVNMVDNEDALWKSVTDRIEFSSGWIEKEVGSIVAQTVGLHLAGVAGKPHVHIHYICNTRFEIKTSASRCNSKTRYIQRMNRDEGQEWGTFRDLTFKFSPMDNAMPKWQILAYPLKERSRSPYVFHYYYWKDNERKNMPKVWVDALENVGGAIFDASKAIRERQDAYKARQLNSKEEMYKFALENRSKFKTFREMREFFEVELLGPNIPIGDRPVMKNFNNNVFIVGNALGLARYCDYDP